MKTEIVYNSNTQVNDCLIYHLRKAFIDASEISFAVAFLKSSGLNFLEKELKRALRKGVKINLIAGLDFGLSDYDALKRLLHLFEMYKNAKLYFAQGISGIFHPKFYLFNNAEMASIIIGSSNFTNGGLENNVECSLKIECSPNSKIYRDSAKYFEDLIKSRDVFEASFVTLEKYKPFQKSQSKIRNRKILRRPKQSTGDELFPLNTKELNNQFNSYIKKKNNSQNSEKRIKDYSEAKGILNKISRIKKIKTTTFYPYYASLVGGSGFIQKWHSGGINRGINKVKKHPKKFQDLVKYAKINHSKPLEEVFENTMNLAGQIPGLGINIVTEILATYNSQKFAIVNNSPIGALGHYGVYVKSKTAFNGIYYRIFCGFMLDIKKIVNARSLLEVDSFFNYIYWKIKNK